MSHAPGLKDWDLSCNRQPMVRVGIVLDCDESQSIDMGIPDAGFQLGESEADHQPVCGSIRFSRRSGKVLARIGDAAEQPADVWRLTGPQQGELHRGDGVLVRGVVAGRGFHWQTRIDQRLCGSLEVRCGAKGLILINTLPIESYLAGVITAEMSSQCPAEFLKAQCVAARSWMLAATDPTHDKDPFDRCNDDCCQRYQGTLDLSDAAISAVRDTHGLVLLAGGGVVDANYSKSCGGVSELPEHVWGKAKAGVTMAVDAPPGSHAHRFAPVAEADLEEFLTGSWLTDTDIYCSPNVVPPAEFRKYLGPVDVGGSYFRWTQEYKRQELESLLARVAPEGKQLSRLVDLHVLERGVSGRVSRLEVLFETATGRRDSFVLPSEYAIRKALHASCLYSSAFIIRTDRDSSGAITSVTLHGAGWGHGAGLCQIGALGMALKGRACPEILSLYFPEARLQNVY